MNNDLRIGLTFKMIALSDKLLTQYHVVFNYSVVNNGKFSVITQMRMSIDICWCAMCCPACMSYSHFSGCRTTVIGLFVQIRDPSHDLIHRNAGVIHHCNTGGVISAIFQLFKSIQQDRRSLLCTCISNDSTHFYYFSLFILFL